MSGLFYRLPAAFVENDLVMSWLLEEDILTGLTAELVRERGFPVRATLAYKSEESWRKRKDCVLIIPAQMVGTFALCYAYGPRDQLVGDKGKVEIIWYRIAVDLKNFCFLQFDRSEGKIRNWLVLEHVSSTKTVQTTTSYFESEQKQKHCIKTVTITVEHDCALCRCTPDKCLCNVKQLEKPKVSPVKSSITEEVLKGSLSKLNKPSFSVPSFAGSLLELLSSSSSRGFIEVAQYSLKEGNLLHYSRTDCFTDILPLKQKSAESCFFQALESLVSKTSTYRCSVSNALSYEEDSHKLLDKSLASLDDIYEYSGFSSTFIGDSSSLRNDDSENNVYESVENEWSLFPDSYYSLEQSSETMFLDRWDV